MKTDVKNKKEYYYVFDENKQLIGVILETTPQRAIKRLNGKYALDLIGNWVFNLCYKITSGVIRYE